MGHPSMEHGQKALYESIHDEYYANLHDDIAEAYLDEFINRPMLELIPQTARNVLEIACGNGSLSAYMKERRPNLQFTGCDISAKACADYERRFGAVVQADLTTAVAFRSQFDAVIVGGGVHHLVTNLDTAMANIAQALIQGGAFIMSEPNADYILEPLRRLWYVLDRKHFEARSEHALSHDKLARQYADLFTPQHLHFAGGPSVYILLHNLFLHLPRTAKHRLARPAMRLERVYAQIPTRYAFNFFIARWIKK